MESLFWELLGIFLGVGYGGVLYFPCKDTIFQKDKPFNCESFVKNKGKMLEKRHKNA